jgi:hypothetical protein
MGSIAGRKLSLRSEGELMVLPEVRMNMQREV